jgi:hypothetical protein
MSASDAKKLESVGIGLGWRTARDDSIFHKAFIGS